MHKKQANLNILLLILENRIRFLFSLQISRKLVGPRELNLVGRRISLSNNFMKVKIISREKESLIPAGGGTGLKHFQTINPPFFLISPQG